MNRFMKLDGDGTPLLKTDESYTEVHDILTGLVWTRLYPELKVSRETAVRQTPDGYRLPTYEEYMGIRDALTYKGFLWLQGSRRAPYGAPVMYVKDTKEMHTMQYVKKPEVVTAWQFTRDNYEAGLPSEFQHSSVVLWEHMGALGGEIENSMGTQKISKNDWLVLVDKEEFRAMRPEIFEMTYEKESSCT